MVAEKWEPCVYVKDKEEYTKNIVKYCDNMTSVINAIHMYIYVL